MPAKIVQFVDCLIGFNVFSQGNAERIQQGTLALLPRLKPKYPHTERMRVSTAYIDSCADVGITIEEQTLSSALPDGATPILPEAPTEAITISDFFADATGTAAPSGSSTTTSPSDATSATATETANSALGPHAPVSGGMAGVVGAFAVGAFSALSMLWY